MKRNFIFGIFAFVLFVAASVYITFPLIFHMVDFVNGELVIAWIMNWNIHAITHGILPFFDANIFYPYHNTLAYSDLFFTSSLVALPFFAVFHEPMLPSNITLLTSLIFLGFFTYLLVFYLTKNFFASLLSGILIIFSPVVLDKRYHLQILAIEFVPLALLFFLHFIKKQQYRFIFLSLLCFVAQTYNSFMAGYFLLFSYAGIFISYFIFERKKVVKIITIKTVAFFICSFLLIVPIAIPYYQVSHEFSFVRDIRETIHLALQPEDLLVTNDISRLKPILWFFDAARYPATAEIKPGFLGGIFTIMTIAAFIYLIYRWRRVGSQNDVILFAFFAIALWGLILSFGPALHLERVTIHHPFLIPLPYALAYYLLPGFQGIRDSSRFEMLFVLSIAVVIGVLVDQLLKKESAVVKAILYALLFIGVVGEFRVILFDHAHTFESFPPVYSWIAKSTPQNAVILEVPVYNWDNNPFGDNREVLREYFSTLHFRKIISGGSGFSPPPWQNFAKSEFANFPPKESIAAIGKYGATYLVVHAKEFDVLHEEKYKAGTHSVYSGKYVLSSLSQNASLRFIIKEGDDYVYQVR